MRGFTKVNRGINEIKIRLTSLENEVRIALGKDVKTNLESFKGETKSNIFNKEDAKQKAKEFYGDSRIPLKNYNELLEYFILMEESKQNNDYKEFSRNAIKSLERIWSTFLDFYGKDNFLKKIQEIVVVKSRTSYGKFIPQYEGMLIDVLYGGISRYTRDSFLKGMKEDFIKPTEIKTFFDHLFVWDVCTNKSKSSKYMKHYVYTAIKYYKDDDSHADDPKFGKGPQKNEEWKIEHEKFKKDPLELLKSNSPLEIIKDYYLMLNSYIDTLPKTK